MVRFRAATWPRLLASMVVVGLALTGCGSSDKDGTDSDGDTAAPAAKGSAALGKKATSLDDIAARLKQATGSCADARKSEYEVEHDIGNLFDDEGQEQLAASFTGAVAAIGRCEIFHRDGSTISTKMLLFKDGGAVTAQQAWKAASVTGPPLKGMFWGNGFAVYTAVVKADTLSSIGVQALRCGQVEELGTTKIPADVDGCWFLAPGTV